MGPGSRPTFSSSRSFGFAKGNVVPLRRGKRWSVPGLRDPSPCRDGAWRGGPRALPGGLDPARNGSRIVAKSSLASLSRGGPVIRMLLVAALLAVGPGTARAVGLLPLLNPDAETGNTTGWVQGSP